MQATLELRLPENIDFELEEVSQAKKEPKEKIALLAISSYLDTFLDLKGEFNLWDKLSDEALVNFEKEIT